MTEKHINALRAINYFNLDGPVCKNRNDDADNIIALSLLRMNNTYKKEIQNNYTFIIDYRNDVYSALAYIMIRNCGGMFKKNLDIRIMGNIKTPEEKKLFNGVKTIDYHKAKKHKKKVLVTGFHPICNVTNIEDLSKNFIEIMNPIERFTPDSINIAIGYYFTTEFINALSTTKTTAEQNKIMAWDKFFTYPISIDNLPAELPPFDKSIPICAFRLYGEEDEFSYYDKIIESAKEGNIHIYLVEGGEKEVAFCQTNLNRYMELRNHISDLSMVDSFLDIYNATTPDDEIVEMF